MQHSPGSTPVWGYLSPGVALRARQNLIHILRQVDPLRRRPPSRPPVALVKAEPLTRIHHSLNHQRNVILDPTQHTVQT